MANLLLLREKNNFFNLNIISNKQLRVLVPLSYVKGIVFVILYPYP